MATKTVRNIIKIDEDKCNGCGICVPSCVEGSLKIIDGKARLVRDSYCDGLGACIGHCPQGALTVETRAAEEFDEEEAMSHAAQTKEIARSEPCACPSSRAVVFNNQTESENQTGSEDSYQSQLTHWPVQLTLVPPGAPFLRNADVLLTAHCVPFAYGGFHQALLKGHVALSACPKLDNADAHLSKLTDVLKNSQVRSLTVVRMEVPCCGGLTFLARQAADQSGANLSVNEIVIGVRGDRKG